MLDVAVDKEVKNLRPTVYIDGQEFKKINDLLLAMNMKEQEGGLSALELRLSNFASDLNGEADYAFESEEEIKLGSTINIYSGDTTAPQEIFRGVVTGLEADFPENNYPNLLVYAEDILQAARMTRRTQVYDDISIEGLSEIIASSLGVTLKISQGFGENIGTWLQLNESDLAFLRRVLRRYDADAQIVGEELHVSPRQNVQRGSVELEMFMELRSVKFIADLTDQVTEVTVSGWDAFSGRSIKAVSIGANLGPGFGRRGSKILSSTIGKRTEHVGHIAVSTNEEAQVLADTVFDQRARRFVCAHGTAVGNPLIRVGTEVKLIVDSARFVNTYYVVATHHRYDEKRGYETDFKAECCALGDV